MLFASGCSQEAPSETNETNESTVSESDKNIMQTLSDDDYVTLVQLINAAGLQETLSTKGPYTVFAPTDEAFQALPTGTVETLMNNTTELRRILSYHVIDGELMEQDLANMTSFQTLEGRALSINNTSEGLQVGGAKITDTDIQCSNGVIHQIDTVLIPPK